MCVCVCLLGLECAMCILPTISRITLRVPFFENIVFFVSPIQKCDCEDSPVSHISRDHVTVM